MTSESGAVTLETGAGTSATGVGSSESGVGEGGRRLRIAFIGARGVIGTYSGIETYYEEVGSRLAARGHQVTAYCRSYFTPPCASHRGVRVRRLPCLRTKHLETASHSLLATLDSLVRGYDVVQFHAIGSAPLALLPRLLGRKTVVSVRGLDWQRAKWGRVARAALRAGEWASARCPSATAVVSATLQAHYRARHGREPEHIPNAVVPAAPGPLERLAEWGLEHRGFLLFAGRISPEKGVHHLLEAFAGIEQPAIPLVLAGGTSYSDDYVREQRRAAPPGTIFLGQVGRAQMEALYSHCHAFVLPSAMEGLSIALLEAVSYGAAIVATEIPENLEVVGEAALTFPPGDVAALRDQLARLLMEPELAGELRSKARHRAEALPGWDEVAARTEAFYLRLTAGAGRGGAR